MKIIETDVLVSGCGPTGAMMGNLLGQYGIKTVIVEREKEIFPLPRAVVIDDDVARVFQFVELDQQLLEVGQPSKGYHFLDQEGRKMFGFKRAPYNIYGYPSSIMIHQPDAEEVLRKGIGRFPHVDLRLEHELVSFEQDEQGVTANIRDLQNDTTIVVKAKYLLASEGARSNVRRTLKVEMDDFHFDHQWIVIDTISAEDLGLPEYNIQYCNATRPTSYIYLGKSRYRWEIMLNPEETREEMMQEHRIRELLSMWTDPDKMTIERSAVYMFHALNAKQWRYGNVFLVGDSAHQTPPFLGQGLVSGVRDAHNICWKVNQVLKHGADPRMLDTYQSERSPHVEQVIRMAVQFGNLIQVKSKEMADMRDYVFQSLHLFPGLSHALQNIERSTLTTGRGFHDPAQDIAAGKLFIQPKVKNAAGETVLMDKTLDKTFVVLGFNQNPGDVLSAESKAALESLNARIVEVKSREHDGTGAIIDIEHAINNWLAVHGSSFVLLRPDRYVYGVYNEGDLNDGVNRLVQAFRTGTASIAQ